MARIISDIIQYDGGGRSGTKVQNTSSVPVSNKIKKANSLKGLEFGMIINYGDKQNEETLNIPLMSLVSFTHKRNVSNTGNTFDLTIQGPLTIELEYKILAGNHRVLFWYGYPNEATRSFEGEVTESDIHFEDLSMAFNIKGAVSVLTKDNSKRSCVYKAGMYLSNIIKLICGAHGWRMGHVEDAYPLEEDVTQGAISDTEFLTTVLNSRVKTKDGISDYKLWFTYDKATTILNYAPLQYCRDSGYEYVYDLYGSADSEMLSFDIKNHGQIAYAVGSSVYNPYLSKESGELLVAKSEDVNKSLANLATSAASLYGRRDIFVNQNKSLVNLTNKNKNDAINSYWLAMYSQTYEAQAKVIGNVFLDAGTVLTVIVLEAEGKAHYSSGQYAITEVTDIISSDGFITDAALVKTLGTSVGSTTTGGSYGK